MITAQVLKQCHKWYRPIYANGSVIHTLPNVGYKCNRHLTNTLHIQECSCVKHIQHLYANPTGSNTGQVLVAELATEVGLNSGSDTWLTLVSQSPSAYVANRLRNRNWRKWIRLYRREEGRCSVRFLCTILMVLFHLITTSVDSENMVWGI